MTGSQRPHATLVMTIKNEADTLPELLESIAGQTLAPAEVIVVDGGSNDDSLAILDRWRGRLPLSVHLAPGVSISEGRNVGIRQATTDLIAVTDAGVRLDPRWLEHLIDPLTQSAIPVDVSAGFFEPDARGSFEIALAATTLPDAEEIDPASFLPSSRSVAFRKSWFDAGVEYPEWLDYGEDLVFDLRLKRAGARFAFQPAAIARFRPRRNVRSFWKQYHLYARGDGKAGLFLKRHLSRYMTYTVVVPLFIVIRAPLWRGLVVLGAIAYMRRPVKRLWNRSGGNVAQTARLAPLAGVLRAIGDFAKMAGYPEGVLWRARTYGIRRGWRSIPERRD